MVWWRLGFGTLIPMKYFLAVCAVLLQLPLVAFTSTDGTDVEFKVKKRCHEYNLRTTTDTLKAVYGSKLYPNRGDTPALPEGVYKFAFIQCPFGQIDSVSADKGKVKLTDSILTYDLRIYLTDTIISSVSFYCKGQLAYFKTFVLLPSYPRNATSTCNCDTGTTSFHLRDMVLGNSGILSKQKIQEQILGRAVSTNSAWVAVKQNNNQYCFETISCTITYTSGNRLRTDKVNIASSKRIWKDLVSNAPVNSRVKLVFRYRRSMQCDLLPPLLVLREKSKSSVSSRSRSVSRTKLFFVLTE